MPARMAEFLLEVYISRQDDDAAARGASAARAAAEEMRSHGVPIVFVRSIFVPDDETCYYLFDATAVEHVLEAARIAGLPPQHVALAITQPLWDDSWREHPAAAPTVMQD